MTEEAAGECAEYDLAAILVHQGPSAYMGHYYALIEDETTGKWFKFNDEDVTELTGKKIPGTDGWCLYVVPNLLVEWIVSLRKPTFFHKKIFWECPLPLCVVCNP